MSAVAYQQGACDFADELDGQGRLVMNPAVFISGLGPCSVEVRIDPSLGAAQVQAAVRDAIVAYAAGRNVALAAADVFTISMARG